jgi:hypothetical protein
MAWIFVPLQDVQHDPEAIVARLLEVADAEGAGVDDDQDDDQEGHQGDAEPPSWSVRASRAVYGDAAVWDHPDGP